MAIEDSGFGINSIELVDNSVATVGATTTLNILPSLHPVFSSDGPDNVITQPSSFNDVLTKYGSDFSDINAYGQQNLNVENVFTAGGSAYVCRLLPDDAKPAHLVVKIGLKKTTDIPLYKRNGYGEFILDDDGNKIPLMAKQTRTVTKVDSETGVEQEVTTEEEVSATTSGIMIKVITEFANEEIFNKFPSASRLSTHYEGTGVDTDGFEVFPLFFTSYYANGKCGKNYGLRIINDYQRDAKVNDGRRYQLFLGKKASTGVEILSIGNGISFSFNPTAQVSRTIPSIEGLQKMYQNYDGTEKKQIQIDFYQNNYDKLGKAVAALIGEKPEITEGIDPDYNLRTPTSMNEFDFINATDREGYAYDNVVISPDSVNLSNYQYLDGGDDGEFENLDGEELEGARNKLLKKFFNGLVDTKNFMNVLMCDAGIMYDANYPMEVKQVMASVIKNRRDICCVFDCGFTENLDEAAVIATTIRSFASSLDGGENFAIVPHCGITTDRVVDVRVTGTYEFAYGLHRLYRLSPFSIYAGQQNSDAGCVRKTLFDWLIEETIPRGYQEKIAKQNRMYWAVDLGKALSTNATGNYTGRNVYFYSNSSLYTETASKLSEFRNGLLVNDIRRVLKLILVKYTFDNDGAEAAIEKANTEIVQKFTSRYPSNVTITTNLYQTDRDKLLNMATCDVAVMFPDIFETWSCRIEVNRAS